jgi:hypothetical protein
LPKCRCDCTRQTARLFALALQFCSASGVVLRPRLLRCEVSVVADQREPLLTGSDAVSTVFKTISGDAEFRRLRALACVDLNRNIGGKLGSDWKPRAGDLRTVGLQLSRRQPRRTRRRFTDDNFSVSLSFLAEILFGQTT